MLTLILIVNFQARLTQELESQTQEAPSSGTEVDAHVVTRHMLGDRRGHERAVGRILKGAGLLFPPLLLHIPTSHLGPHQFIQVMRSWLLLELRHSITRKG